MTVFVGPSIWRSMDVRTATAMFAAMTSNPTDERVIWAPLWNDALIGRSRSIMCSEFLKTDADVMVIIDDDIVFEPQDFWKIVEGVRETRGVYGGAYVTRSTEPHLSSRPWPNTSLHFRQTPNRRPVEFQYLATGFFAIHRDVLEAMIKGEFRDAFGTHRVPLVELGGDRPFYPFFSPFTFIEDDGRYHYLSEDWAFCARAHQLGFGVWVDQSIILLHMGWYPFSVADLDNARPGFPSTGIDLVEVTGNPEVTGEPLIDSEVADIAAFCEESEGDVSRMLPLGTQKLFEAWETKSADESEEDWYKREDVGLHYMCDLAWWHRRGGGMPTPLAEGMAGKRVLEFGSGIGTAALAFARAGAAVHAVEVNPTLRDLIRARAQRHDLVLSVSEELPAGTYDVIVAWHVLEHLAEPERWLDELLARLEPGGRFISQSGYDDQDTPMHHDHPDWEGVLRSRGLQRVAHDVYELAAEAVAV